MPRTRAIFEWVFQLPSSAQSSSQPSGRPYELSFKTAPDDGMSTEVGAFDITFKSSTPRRGLGALLFSFCLSHSTSRLFTARNVHIYMYQVAAGRRAKEMKSLRNLPTTSNRVRTMHQLHSFIFEEHVAYASSRHSKMPEVLDPAVLSTY
jgi:hypothetical protein